MKAKFPPFLILIAFTVFTSCNSGYSNGAISKTYEFKCNSINSACQECDDKWFISIETKNNATIYSSTSASSYLKSCSTDITYSFDETTGSITIQEMVNPNVSNSCRSNFLGTYTFNKKGINGIGFYKRNDCGFSR